MRHAPLRLLASALLLGLLAAPAVSAQSVAFRSVSGTVVDPARRPVPGAFVTLTDVAGGGEVSLRTNSAGRFTFALVAPGSYELRIEALGFRPLVAQGLSLSDADVRSLSFRATPAAPPVVTVDTVQVTGGVSGRTRPGSVNLPSSDLTERAYRYGDLAALATTSPLFDSSLGALGLPGEQTVLVADGVPVHRAPHPTARAELVTGGPFSQTTLSGLSAYHNPSDIEWAGGAGGYVGLATLSGTGEGFGGEVAYSGGPIWSSSELDFSAPSLLSLQGATRGTLQLGDGRQLVVAADALRHQTPLAPRVTEATSAELTGLDADLLASLGAPDVETYARYTGLARLDARGDGSRFFLRAAASLLSRSFDGPGPATLGGAVALPEESVDFSVAGAWTGEQSPELTVELRAGLSGSYRNFDPDGTALPPAQLVGAGAPLGGVPSSVGESSRTDLVLNPVFHMRMQPGTLKLGASLRGTRHTIAHSRAGAGDFFFSDGAAVLSGTGAGQLTEASEASFLAAEVGAFGQFLATPAPGVRLTLGARVDLETFAKGDVALNDDWLAAAGLPSDSVVNSFPQLGLRAALEWEPSPGGGPKVHATASMQHGDLDSRLVAQLIGEVVDGTAQRYAGTGIDWPGGALPPAAPTALPAPTLLGYDLRPPRSAVVSAGIIQPIAGSWRLSLTGVRRRTDFLMRRRDLNGALASVALDTNGRPLFGTLEQNGSVLSTPGDARRFDAFGEVWALDPDGWSEYRAVTASLSHAGPSVDLYGSYAYSETTDNWRGAHAALVDAELSPRIPEEADTPWDEATSDFDVPHRASAGATLRVGSASISARYLFRSGRPFTPGYRHGVDANGDGSARNDAAFVPGGSELTMLLDSWPCLEDQAGLFAARNSCRGPSEHRLDVRVALRLGRLGGRAASFVVDGLNLIESTGGVLDEALLLVDPAGSVSTAPDGTVTVPTVINPGFGQTLYPATRGRMVRLGVRIGG